MTPDAFLAEWHRVVRERDVAALAALLAPEVEIGAPPYWEPFRGAPITQHLLGLILATVEGFTYQREWRDGGEPALEFRGRVGALELQGIDLISLDASGRIRRLDVLMRPVNTVNALIEKIAPLMLQYLTERSRPR
jgi:hypothetical protein